MIKEEIKLDINTCKHFDREVGCEKEVCVCEQQEPKQEKVRESAGRILREKYPYHPPQDYGYWVDMFVEGAEWQAEQMYSEEDMKKAIRFGFDKGFCSNSSNKVKNNLPSEKEWFKQFKKK
jgi:hypothetical protein